MESDSSRIDLKQIRGPSPQNGDAEKYVSVPRSAALASGGARRGVGEGEGRQRDAAVVLPGRVEAGPVESRKVYLSHEKSTLVKSRLRGSIQTQLNSNKPSRAKKSPLSQDKYRRVKANPEEPRQVYLSSGKSRRVKPSQDKS